MKNTQILVVEDSDVSGAVTSGEEGIKLVEYKRPDLVLMDIMLEGEMDGIETADKIRS
jgi:CheY-like chemotaxis protein